MVLSRELSTAQTPSDKSLSQTTAYRANIQITSWCKSLDSPCQIEEEATLKDSSAAGPTYKGFSVLRLVLAIPLFSGEKWSWHWGRKPANRLEIAV